MLRISLVPKAMLLLLVVNLWAGPALAAAPLRLTVDHRANLSAGGAAVTVSGKLRCPAGYQVLEAFIYVVQDQNSSQFAALPVTCNGKLRAFRVTVQAYPDSAFRAGPATTSGYLLLLDPASGGTVSTSPTGSITLR